MGQYGEHVLVRQNPRYSSDLYYNLLLLFYLFIFLFNSLYPKNVSGMRWRRPQNSEILTFCVYNFLFVLAQHGFFFIMFCFPEYLLFFYQCKLQCFFNELSVINLAAATETVHDNSKTYKHVIFVFVLLAFKTIIYNNCIGLSTNIYVFKKNTGLGAQKDTHDWCVHRKNLQQNVEYTRGEYSVFDSTRTDNVSQLKSVLVGDDGRGSPHGLYTNSLLYRFSWWYSLSRMHKYQQQRSLVPFPSLFLPQFSHWNHFVWWLDSRKQVARSIATIGVT